jgi:hypothetical protein
MIEVSWFSTGLGILCLNMLAFFLIVQYRRLDFASKVCGSFKEDPDNLGVFFCPHHHENQERLRQGDATFEQVREWLKFSTDRDYLILEAFLEICKSADMDCTKVEKLFQKVREMKFPETADRGES